jgi:hypothetical protein
MKADLNRLQSFLIHTKSVGEILPDEAIGYKCQLEKILLIRMPGALKLMQNLLPVLLKAEHG